MRRGIKVWIVERENYAGGNRLPHVSLEAYGQRCNYDGENKFRTLPGGRAVGGTCAAFKQPSIQSRACTHKAGTIDCKAVHGRGCRHGIAWSGAALIVAIQGARHAAHAAVASART